jgi:hypothetical protein
MPFTIAHPAAVIPLKKPLKKYGVMSALVIGSLIPDLVRLPFISIERAQSHSLPGVFLYCLPAGIFLYFVFEYLMKGALIELLPVPVQRRLDRDALNGKKALTAGSFFNVCVSILIGAATHILWDSFTHEDGFLVESFIYLRTRIFSASRYDSNLYILFYHLSTLIGVFLTIYWIIKWYRTAPVRQNDQGIIFSWWQRLLWFALILAGPAAIGILAGLISAEGMYGFYAVRTFVRGTVVSGLVAVSLIMVMYIFVYHFSAIKFNKRE